MKTRLSMMVVALSALFTIVSAHSTYANHVLVSIPLNSTSGTCTFNGNFNVVDFVNNGGVIEGTGSLVGTITDTNDPLNPSDDVTTPVNQPAMIAVSFEGTTCTSLNLTDTEEFSVMSDCGAIPLSFTNARFMFPERGGKYNLINNSLCAIQHYYDNGQKASINSLYAHVKNLVRALHR